MPREKKKNPCFRSHILCPRFEHNYFTKLDYGKKTGMGVKQFVLILSYRPLHTFSSTLSCSMDANLVVDRRWEKYQIKLFTISQLLNLNPCFTYKKLPACKTAKILTAFLLMRKKSIIVFNHVNTDWLIISLLNTVIEKKLKLGKQNMETDKWLGNLCRTVKTRHLTRCFSHIKSAFFKSKDVF